MVIGEGGECGGKDRYTKDPIGIQLGEHGAVT